MKGFSTRPFLAIGVAAICLALAGCGTVSTRSALYAGVPRFPPSDPAKIELLPHEPARPHERLGEVFVDTVDDPARERIDSAVKEEAARLGADAVFFVMQRSWVTNYVYWDPAWGPSNNPVPSRAIIGVAIKYTGG